MQVFDVDCTIAYEVVGPTDFLFQIEAAHAADQQVQAESLIVEPAVPIRRFTDLAGDNRYIRLHSDGGALTLHYQARVALNRAPIDLNADESPIAQLPDEALRYLVPTRYCESDLLYRTALRTFGALPPGYTRVEAISQWVREHIEYEIGSSSTATTARDILVNRAGVCRDFAHLCIAFCRALNIPARLVVGYVKFDEPPPDFHALFEAFIGGRWMLFDPTGLAPVSDLVRIGAGQDAKDVAFATLFGNAQMVWLAPDVAAAPA